MIPSFPFDSFHSKKRERIIYMDEQKRRSHRFNENGSIVVHNYCAAELPQITVTIQSGQTTYRFGGRYDGTRSLSAKLLDRMANEIENEKV